MYFATYSSKQNPTSTKGLNILKFSCDRIVVSTLCCEYPKVHCNGILFEKYPKVFVKYWAAIVNVRSIPNADDK